MSITIGGWVIFIIGLIALLIGGGLMAYYMKKKETMKVILSVVSGVLLAALCIGGVLIYSGTEAGKRAYKDQESNFSGGIRRTVTVYDINGNLVKEYAGEFDVETENLPDYFLFDDEQGKRHIVIPGTSTVFIDEHQE